MNINQKTLNIKRTIKERENILLFLTTLLVAYSIYNINYM